MSDFLPVNTLIPPVPLPENDAVSITVPAPAKLNLFLHVVGRRPDGYHLLESVFFMVTLADTLTFTRGAPGTGVMRTGDMAEHPEKDLCVRAVRALEQYTDRTFDLTIDVTKRIPSGAGMGGGSSDAATTLIALNRWYRLGLTRAELIDVAETLGADVPFFIFGETAFVTGIGEKQTPIALPAGNVLLVMPSVATSTAGIFADPGLTRDTSSLKIANLSSEIVAQWPRPFGRNDLEPVVLRRNAETKSALAHLGDGARMTGSGSAVFRLLTVDDTVSTDVPAGMQGWLATIQPQHPLFHWL